MYKTLFLVLFCFGSMSMQGQDLHRLAQESFNRTLPYFPPLKKATIKIKIRAKGSAMAAAYTWWSVFRRPAKRKYFIKVNKNVEGAFMCFQFDHLTRLSRDGVLGHELAHIDFFNSLNFFGFLKFIINQGLPGGIKKSERATDYRTIEVGLGKELKSWSTETRDGFKAASEETLPKKYGNRYFTPSEIDSVMQLFPKMY